MIIVFSGTDGAGKTTQAKLLRDQLVAEGFDACILDKWDIFNSNKFPECRFLNCSLSTLQECISEMDGAARAMFLFWAIDITLKEIRNSKHDRIFILDGYWIKHAASEIVFGQKREWVEGLISSFPVPDLIFYFKIDPIESSKRKHSAFTSYECGRDKDKSLISFIQHQTKVKKIMDDWSQSNNWIEIDSISEPNAISEKIKRHVIQIMRNKND